MLIKNILKVLLYFQVILLICAYCICSEIPKLKQIALEMKVQQPQEQSSMFAYVRIAEKCD